MNEQSALSEQPRQLAAPGLHEKVVSLLEDLPRGRALDLGAGEGAFSKVLKRLSFDTHACDIDPALFQVKEIPFRAGDINDQLPFEDSFFDLVVLIEVLEHLTYPWRALTEIRRILRTGGKLILTTPNVTNLFQRFYFLTHGRFYGFGSPVIRNPLEHIHPFSISELRMMLNENHFSLETTTFDRPFKLKKFLPTNALTGLTSILLARKIE